MGTRHLIAVQLDGEYKLAQYGQWDGYPSGQGLKVLAFLRTASLEAFRAQCRRLRWASKDEQEDAWVAAGAERDTQYVSLEASDKLEELRPEMSRNTGAKILNVVLESPAPERLLMRNMIDFAQDGLFCEWAYVIDFDKNTFEVYDGFHKEEVSGGRFAGPKAAGRNEYGPVQLVKSYALDALPDEDTFLSDLERNEDDNDDDEEEAAA